MSIFWKGLKLGRERLCPWLTFIQVKYLLFLPEFSYQILYLLENVGISFIADIAAWWNYQSMKSWWLKLLSFHMPCKSKFSQAMRTYIFLAEIEVKVNCRKRILEEFNFLPLPPSGYIDENAYVLESYEFYSAFS